MLLLTASHAAADVCVAIDEAHDRLTPPDRAAALLVLGRQFELAGERVVSVPCSELYSVSHVQLGPTIFVTLSGPKGDREAKAAGLDDLRAVYNQMVRSLLTGKPMDLRGVVDRTNVSAAQATTLRVHSDSVVYARLGYGAIFAGRAQGAPSVGLIGYRHELDSFAIDVSFLNFQINNWSGSDGYYGSSTNTSSASWVKMEGLYFKNPQANQSAYYGGGLSWNGMSIHDGTRSLDGSGLQGELTAGYEIARASTIRLFVQADAGIPFYSLRSTSYSFAPASYPLTQSSYYPPVPVTSQQWAPSLTFSMGLGWQKKR
jgi:hypothetical protein